MLRKSILFAIAASAALGLAALAPTASASAHGGRGGGGPYGWRSTSVAVTLRVATITGASAIAAPVWTFGIRARSSMPRFARLRCPVRLPAPA